MNRRSKCYNFPLDYKLQFSKVLEPSIEGYTTGVEETFEKKVWILTKNSEGMQVVNDNEEVEMKEAIIRNKNKTRLVKISY